MRRPTTAALSAAGLLVGFGTALESGSRLLGGLVLALFGLGCILIWWRRDGSRIALALGAIGLAAFALSHALGLLIGAWPAVLVASGGLAAASWRLSDARPWQAAGRRRASARVAEIVDRADR